MAGEEDIMLASCPENTADSIPRVAEEIVVISTPHKTVFLTRGMFPAPMFCDTKGATATPGAAVI